MRNRFGRVCRCEEGDGLRPLRTSAAAALHPAAAHRDKMYSIQTPKPAASPHRSSSALQTRSPCSTVGELHKDVQAIKVHMGRMVHEWESYTEGTGFTRAPAVGLVFLPLK